MPVSNPAGQLTYTSCMSAKKNPTGHTAWENWDISAIISGASTVDVLCFNQTANQAGGAREDGSADNRYITPAAAEWGMVLKCEVNSDIIEIYAGAATTTWDFYIVGYEK